MQSDLNLNAANVLRVADTLVALGELAHFHRRRWAGQLIAIGGSVGKTTTTKTLSALLKSITPDQVHHTAGNLNNQIGVPMTLLGLNDKHRYAVVELGTSILGEMALLMRIVEPDVALLTTITLEHPEGLGDLESIEKEEGALFTMLSTQSIVLTQTDDQAALRQLAKSPSQTKVEAEGEGAAAGYTGAQDDKPHRTKRQRLAWGKLLARVFKVDVSVCANLGWVQRKIAPMIYAK